MRLFTIGYQNATQADVIERLGQAAVRMVIDVRALAGSRKPGFSKSSLAASLAAHGISYRHLRALGTPPDGRAAARAGWVDDLVRIYTAHLAEPAAQSALLEAAELARVQPSALLCFCTHAYHCHRHMIADRLGASAIVHL